MDLFHEPVLSVCVGLETFLLPGVHSSRASFRASESREHLGDDRDSRTRGETRMSIDLPEEEEELEQLPDRLGTAPRAFPCSMLSGDLGGELVGGGGRSEKMVPSNEFSCLLDQPLS